MIFEFKLDSIENVQPWGKPDNLELHWFALTQGIYRLRVGDEYLLNYSDEFIEYLSKNHGPSIYKGTYVDYYIVRLWEDLISILPNLLEPIPKDLQYFFESDYKTWKNWFGKVDIWRENQINKDISCDIAELSTYWLQNRYLNSFYLSPSANIWIWSDENDVIICWDNQEIAVDGLQVWSATRGNYRLTREKFIAELQKFDQKLFAEMDKRVNKICKTWNNKKIFINFSQLKNEQINRATWMNCWFKVNYKTDWQKIFSAIEMISE